MLFISHSSKDENVVRALIDLIRSALAISPEEILCTSVPGYTLQGGVNINDTLREEVEEATAFIALLSYNSLQSLYVTFELGARWGAGKHFVPLRAPGVDTDILQGPLSALKAISCESSDDLHQLVKELAERLQLKLYNHVTYQHQIEKVLALPPASKLSIPKYLTEKLELDYSKRKDSLTGSQKAILTYLESVMKKLKSIPQNDIQQTLGYSNDSLYWRLETLCLLGFIEKEETGEINGVNTFNFKLSNEYKSHLK